MIEIKKITTEKGFAETLKIRFEVFVDEQGVPAEIERDEDDQRAAHVLAQYQGENAGCGRLVVEGKKAKIGRVAVRKTFRKLGVGTVICQELIQLAEEKGCQKVELHAQLASADFYKKLGFKKVSNKFREAGIEHIKMEMNL